MSTLAPAIDARLARAVAVTGRLRDRLDGAARPLRGLGRGIDFLARGVHHVWRNRRYLSAYKLLNMAAVNLCFKLKTERVIGRPYKMKIESTNICNTRCQLCPTGLGYHGRHKGRMGLSQFQALVERFRHHLVALDLSMWGDPLIVPDIYHMVRYAHDRRIWTYLSSNLHAFRPDKQHAEKLIDSGLDQLTCSLHGASQRTFELYQPGKDFDTAVAKVRHLIAVRDRLGSRTPDVQLNFVVTRHNEHERAAFETLSADLGCHAVFSLAALNTRMVNRNREMVELNLAEDVKRQRIREHIDHWLPRDERYVLDAYLEMRDHDVDPERYNGSKVYDCSWPWRQAVINWDGTVATCCGSFSSAEDMGNIFEQSFAQVWNGPRYRAARRSFSKRIPAGEADDNPCARCPGFLL